MKNKIIQVISSLKQSKSSIINLLFRQKTFAIAIISILFAVIFSVLTNRHNDDHIINMLREPAKSPFAKNIAGTGFIQANTNNIELGSFSSGIIDEVIVKEGDRVKQGDRLIKLDSKIEESNLKAQQYLLDCAKDNVELNKIKHEEDVDQLNRAQKLNKNAIAPEELFKKKAKYKKSKIQLDLANSQLLNAEQNLEIAKINLSKKHICAPIDGLILKVNVNKGEYVNESSLSQGLLLIGNDNPLNIKVQIDEHDIINFDKKAKALAFIPGLPDKPLELKFLRIEPYASSKTNMSGNVGEIIDTRVISVVYEVTNKIDNLYIGQQVDVFIEKK